MNIAWIIIRIAALPFIAVLAVIGLCAHLLVWVFDSTYDHEAALEAFYTWGKSLNSE